MIARIAARIRSAYASYEPIAPIRKELVFDAT
jgi:hypothetical protein